MSRNSANVIIVCAAVLTLIFTLSLLFVLDAQKNCIVAGGLPNFLACAAKDATDE